MRPDAQPSWFPLPRSELAGRAPEHDALRSALHAARAGHGSLVLISGEAGIGKTALVHALAGDAAALDCLVLTGSCYDGASTPPYGPWHELISGILRRGDLPAPPSLLLSPDAMASAPTSGAIVAALQSLLDTLVEHGPLVLVLEDLHWADPESLDVLRIVARQISDMPILLIATYRDEDLALNQTLYQLVPHLVRESNAQRIGLRHLDEAAVHALIARRFALPEHDVARLASHLESRSQGIPLYVVELLRTLEQEQRLRHTADGWTLGDIDSTQVPALIKQIIDGRIAPFSAEIRRLVELAAVIGQDVPILLWRRASGASEDLLGEAIERATRAHVLEEAPSDLHLQFTHALVRDAVYEALPLPRRQMWHRRIAEALATEPRTDPDTVAHHFRQALDPCATEWFIRAGTRAERVAWLTAARHFEMALEMMGGDDVDPAERGWLLLRRAKLLRNAEPRTSLAILETAEALASAANDSLLLAYVTFFRGQIRRYAGEMRLGIADLEASVNALAQLDAAQLDRAAGLENQGIVLSRAEVNGQFAALLAVVGRNNEALQLADRIIEHASDVPARAWCARAIALNQVGQPLEAVRAYRTALDA